MTEPFWTPERVEQLTESVIAGMSYEAIGQALGCSKNAAIGKARRLDIAEMHPLSDVAMSFRSQPATVHDRLAALDVFPPPGGCVYPIGHPRAADFRFCADRVPVVGEPYCPAHRAKCCVPDKSSQRGAR